MSNSAAGRHAGVSPARCAGRATRQIVAMLNQLYYGDKLDVLRRHINDESVDLVYPDRDLDSFGCE
jgi:hypothetical protein